MQDVEGQIQHQFLLLSGSMADPIFLLILCAGFLIGLFAGWGTGMILAIFFAAVRVGVIDWQEFVPGAEPSATLAETFLLTVIMSLLALAAGKFLRMLMLFPRRTRR